MPPKKHPKAKANEIHIKEAAEAEEYFRRSDDATVLPPELNITMKDGFRFGIGFILASLIFTAVAMVGVILFIKLAPLINFG